MNIPTLIAVIVLVVAGVSWLGYGVYLKLSGTVRIKAPRGLALGDRVEGTVEITTRRSISAARVVMYLRCSEHPESGEGVTSRRTVLEEAYVLDSEFSLSVGQSRTLPFSLSLPKTADSNRGLAVDAGGTPLNIDLSALARKNTSWWLAAMVEYDGPELGALERLDVEGFG